MSCETCRPLASRIEIEVPLDLKRAIALAKENVANGVLKVITHFDDGRKIHAEMPFEELSIDQPWPDIVGYHIACIGCNGIFLLSADTFHGSGGAWERSSGPR